MADNARNGLARWVTKAAGFGVLTLNSGLAIHRARGDLASILFVTGSYTALLLLFRCLQDYERAAEHLITSRARRGAVRPLATVLTLGVGVVNCDMALSMHKAARSDPGSATCVLLSYAVLLALVWLLVREFADHARGVGAVDAARSLRRDKATVGIVLLFMDDIATVAFGFC